MTPVKNMALVPATAAPDAAAIEQVLIGGDLSKLTDAQRVSYYNAICQSLGLNPLTQPFAYIPLNGKLRLYALKDATEQLRKIHGVSVTQLEKLFHEGLYIVTAHASDKTARTDASTGAVSISGLKGENLANALMKAETKAKRRVTLSICGLGMLDETEAETLMPAPAVTAVTTVVDGQTINTITGEQVPVDDGLLRITGVQRQDTTSKRGCWKLTLSDGRECYAFKEQDAAIAEQFAQASTPVVVDVKDSKRGLDLVALRAFGAAPPVPEESPEGPAAPAPPIAVDEKDIPF